MYKQDLVVQQKSRPRDQRVEFSGLVPTSDNKSSLTVLNNYSQKCQSIGLLELLSTEVQRMENKHNTAKPYKSNDNNWSQDAERCCR